MHPTKSISLAGCYLITSHDTIKGISNTGNVFSLFHSWWSVAVLLGTPASFFPSYLEDLECFELVSLSLYLSLSLCCFVRYVWTQFIERALYATAKKLCSISTQNPKASQRPKQWELVEAVSLSPLYSIGGAFLGIVDACPSSSLSALVKL